MLPGGPDNGIMRNSEYPKLSGYLFWGTEAGHHPEPRKHCQGNSGNWPARPGQQIDSSRYRQTKERHTDGLWCRVPPDSEKGSAPGGRERGDSIHVGRGETLPVSNYALTFTL